MGHRKCGPITHDHVGPEIFVWVYSWAKPSPNNLYQSTRNQLPIYWIVGRFYHPCTPFVNERPPLNILPTHGKPSQCQLSGPLASSTLKYKSYQNFLWNLLIRFLNMYIKEQSSLLNTLSLVFVYSLHIFGAISHFRILILILSSRFPALTDIECGTIILQWSLFIAILFLNALCRQLIRPAVAPMSKLSSMPKTLLLKDSRTHCKSG